MTKPNNKSIVANISQLMHADPRRFAQMMNSGMCLGTLNQVAQDGTNAQPSPTRSPFANYGACVNLNERLLGEMGGTEPLIYQCRYDRERARQYALQWGSSDAFKDATPGMIIGADTDCTNFASQVLAAGGFRPTNNWYYTRYASGYMKLDHSQSWTAVNCLLAWLTGSGYSCTDPINGSDKYQDMMPAAQVIKVENVDFKNPVSVVMASQQAEGIIGLGDLVFYETPRGYWHHVSAVVGWGQPYADNIPSGIRFLPNTRVPWIVDHGASFYPAGRMRAYNRHQPYLQPESDPVTVYFVHIPDNFTLYNVRDNGRWDW